MLTTKQRSNLNRMAQTLPTMVFIGKNGLTDAVYAQISETLELKELVKVGIQKAADLDSAKVIKLLCQKLKAEPVHHIGSKAIIYRRSSREGIEHIVF